MEQKNKQFSDSEIRTAIAMRILEEHRKYGRMAGMDWHILAANKVWDTVQFVLAAQPKEGALQEGKDDDEKQRLAANSSLNALIGYAKSASFIAGGTASREWVDGLLKRVVAADEKVTPLLTRRSHPKDDQRVQEGLKFQSAASGLWYEDPMAAGDIAAIEVDGARRYDLASPIVLERIAQGWKELEDFPAQPTQEKVEEIMGVVKDWEEYDTRTEHGSAGENEYLDIAGFYLFYSDLRARLTEHLNKGKA